MARVLTRLAQPVAVGAPIGALLCLTAAPVPASQPTPEEIADKPLEELLMQEVEIASRTKERAFQAPAAVSVITADEIRRSGATSIPELLRPIPGVQVARQDSHTWAVTSRGFNDEFANKLLVMIDGRSVYTPLFSGVFWDTRDTFLEDIDQIEVIRGPGASLWGANAVNGVINIVTKDARDTQGTLITGGGGTLEQGFGGVRYGDRINDDAHYRVYAKYFNRDHLRRPDGGSTRDAWQVGRGGFRMDWDPTLQNQITFQGDFFVAQLDQLYRRVSPTPPHAAFEDSDRIDTAGGNALLKFRRELGTDSHLEATTYYDRVSRDAVILDEDRDIYDVDLQYTVPVGARHQLTMGGGYRLSADRLRGSFDVQFDPDRRTTHLFHTFVQDEIALIEDRLSMTVGSKFSHNDFTGVEVQPTARLSWTPHARHTFWTAVSRAVRTPSRAEDDIRLNQSGPPGLVTSLFGTRDFKSERVIAYELGYRAQPHRRVGIDIATFYNDYTNLRSLERGDVRPTPAPPHVPLFLGNELEAESYGVELGTTLELTEWWRWRLSYTFFELGVTGGESPRETAAAGLEGSDPQHQVSGRSFLDLPADWTLDVGLRYVDNLPSRRIPSYLELDARLGWAPIDNLELSIVGNSLLDDQHPEFAPSFIASQQAEVQHSVFGKVLWQF